jgi:3-dehydroquinate synthase class II
VHDNIVLIMRFHPVGGEDVSVVSEDFAGEREALDAVARALDERRSLVLIRARYDRQADENGVIINLANVVSVRVSRADSAAAAGQYL